MEALINNLGQVQGLQRLGNPDRVAAQALRLAQQFQKSKGVLAGLGKIPVSPIAPANINVDDSDLFTAQQMVTGLGQGLLNQAASSVINPSPNINRLSVQSLLHR